MDIYYKDLSTGETTRDHKKAVLEWFNNGHDIQVYQNNTPRVIWTH